MNEWVNTNQEQYIDVCICTFRRPHVAETIRSVAQLILKPNWKLRIIVADNDETASAKELVNKVAGGIGVPLTYIHVPAFNISVARNACLDVATAPLVAFIDDDEIVSERWLDELMMKMENSNADVVLGPVKAVYSYECPDWMAKGDFHSTKPVFVDGKIITGYSGNVLLRRLSPSMQGLRFRIDLGLTGGEDTVFFSSAYKAGGVITYAPEAIVTEPVSAQRATLSWLLKRHFRCGGTHGLLLLEESSSRFTVRIKHIIKAAAKTEFCLIMALLNAVVSGRMVYWLLRGTMHAGVVFAVARNTNN